MTTLIVLIVLIALGLLLVKTASYSSYSRDVQDLLGVLLIIGSSVFLLVHLLAWSLVGYEYEKFAARRNAFNQTLQESRKSGNQYETAAIVKEVAGWNVELATEKYNNSTLFLDQYVDDRIEDLKPIK